MNYPIFENTTGVVVDFAEKGMSPNSCSICMDVSDVTGTVDIVVIADTRLSFGEKD